MTTRFRTLLLLVCAAAGIACRSESVSEPERAEPERAEPERVSVFTRLELTPATADIEQGDTVGLAVVALDQRGLPIVPREIIYSSNFLAIATVSMSGRVNGIAPGTAEIVAMVTVGPSTRRASMTVNVRPPHVVPLLISGVMTPQNQGVQVSRGGVPVTDAIVTVNGFPIPHYRGDLYWGNLPGEVPAGGTLNLKVVAGGVTFEAPGEVIATPIITAPAAGSTLASTDTLKLAWSSPTDPDQFAVCLNCWENNSNDGATYYTSGSAREFKMFPNGLADYGEGTPVAVYAYKSNFLKSTSSPEVTSNVLFMARSRDALIRVTPLCCPMP